MNCPICDSTAASKQLAEFSTFVCENCGFIFADPNEKSSAPELYDETWSKTQIHPTYVYANGQFVVHNAWKLQSLLDKLERFRKLDRILDVGCSAAFFLKLAKDRGWRVQGVEVAEWAAKYSTETLGVPVFQGMLHEAKFPDASFDVAFSSHVVEHVQRPETLIEEMKRVIRPGGAIVITVPTQFRSPTYLFWHRFYGEGPPRHVSFFNRKSLEKMLEGRGFEVVDSNHNIELHLIKDRLRRKKPTPQAKQDDDGATRRSASVHEPTAGVRMVKTIANQIGTSLGIGDEICTIAIKKT